ncbi:hypothetical protein Tco_0712872 [Tanacetum coccineum]
MTQGHSRSSISAKVSNFGLNIESEKGHFKSVSSEDEGVTRVTTFIAITEDEPSVGKVDDRSGMTQGHSRLCVSTKVFDSGSNFESGKGRFNLVSELRSKRSRFPLVDAYANEALIRKVKIEDVDVIMSWSGSRFDTAYPRSCIRRIGGFLGVGTTLDIFQNIIFIPYFQYGVLVFSGYGVLSFVALVSARHDTPISLMDMAYWSSE